MNIFSNLNTKNTQVEKKVSFKRKKTKRFKSIQLKSKKTNIPYFGNIKNVLSYQFINKKFLNNSETQIKKRRKDKYIRKLSKINIPSKLKNGIKNQNSKTNRVSDVKNIDLEKYIISKIKNLKNKNFLVDPKNIFKVLTNLEEYILQLMIHLKKKSDSKKIKVLKTIVNKLFSPSKKINHLLFNNLQKNNYCIESFQKLCFFLLFFNLKKKYLFYLNSNIKYSEENFDNLFFNDLKRVTIFLKEKIEEINNKNLIYLNNKNNNSISKIKKLQKIRNIKNFTSRNLVKHYNAPKILTHKFFYQFKENKNLFAENKIDDFKYKLILDYNNKLKKFINNSFHQIRENKKLFN